jgi:hypothetical protein
MRFLPRLKPGVSTQAVPDEQLLRYTAVGVARGDVAPYLPLARGEAQAGGEARVERGLGLGPGLNEAAVAGLDGHGDGVERDGVLRRPGLAAAERGPCPVWCGRPGFGFRRRGHAALC